MKRKIGVFLFLLGLLLLGLFLLSDVADSPDFTLLVGGVASLAFGMFMLTRSPASPPAPTERFHTVKSLGKKKAPPKK